LNRTRGQSTRFQITNLNGQRKLRLLAAGYPVEVPPRQSVVEGVHLGPVFNEVRSEEHTSELQSRFDLVCRLLLEKKKNKKKEVVIQNRFKALPARQPHVSEH